MKVYTQNDIPEKIEGKTFSKTVFSIIDNDPETVYFDYHYKTWYDSDGNPLFNNFKWIYPPKELLV